VQRVYCAPVRILISNDDGYRARGINALREALESVGDVTVVAPDRNRSGASNSLTLERPLRVEQADADVYFVQGTPTDCVHLAISGLFPFEPDMVVSGVNDGSNLGDDVLYSGTVAAATEGRFLGKTAVAVSLNTDGLRGDATRYFETGAHFARVIVERLMATPLGRPAILNVNVPNLPIGQVKGIKVTRLGNRHRSEALIRAEDPRGRPVYWIGPAGAGQDAGPGTDFHAVSEGYVSVTPLTVDLTNHSTLASLREWVGTGS
jgi:5'-nucleotidase